MRIVQPIIRRFRNQLQNFGTYPISNNWWYRRILYLMEKANCILTCVGLTATRTVTILPTMTLVRIADSLAKKTTIRNTGANKAYILEDGVIVGAVNAGQMFYLPLTGQLEIKAHCDTGMETTLEVVTRERCLCGDNPPIYDSDMVAPTNGKLV